MLNIAYIFLLDTTSKSSKNNKQHGLPPGAGRGGAVAKMAMGYFHAVTDLRRVNARLNPMIRLLPSSALGGAVRTYGFRVSFGGTC